MIFYHVVSDLSQTGILQNISPIENGQGSDYALSVFMMYALDNLFYSATIIYLSYKSMTSQPWFTRTCYLSHN